MTEQNGRQVEILSKERVFDGYFAIDRYRLRHDLFDGGRGPEIVREVFERGHAAAVLPYDPARDAVVLIEQFRIGAHAAGVDAWMLEIVAGIIEAGEDAETVARREAAEEAGLAIGPMFKMLDYLPSPGACSESIALYCARTEAVGDDTIHGLKEEGEDIRVSICSVDEIPALLDAGKCANATTVIALQWLLLHHDEVRSRWG